MEIRYYQNTGSDFNSGLETYNTDVRRTQSTSGNFAPIEVVAPASGHTRVSDIVSALSTNDEGTIYGYRDFYQGLYIVNIHGKLKGVSDKDAVAMFDKVEAKAMELLAKAFQSSLHVTITHYDPFTPEALSDSGHNAGDVIVKVTDKNGNPVSNQNVYLFTEKLHGLDFPDNSRSELIDLGFSSSDISNIIAGGLPGYNWDSYEIINTNQYGIATYNYLSGINTSMVTRLLKKYSHADCKVWAAVFDKDPPIGLGTTNQQINVTSSDSFTADFKSIAIITRVYSTDPDDQKVRVMSMNNGVPAGSKAVTNGMTPYGLMSGDEILLEKGDKVDINWLCGYKVHIETARNIWQALSDQYTVKVDIGDKDMGWYQYINQRMTPTVSLGAGLGGTGFWALFSTPNPYKLGWTAVTTGIALGWNVQDKISSPIIVVPRSTFIVDFNNDTSTISTVEGQVTVMNLDNNVVNVTTGHTINISGDGSYGPLNSFEVGNLNSDQQQAIAVTANITQAGTTPTGSPKASPFLFGFGAVLALVAMGYLKRR